MMRPAPTASTPKAALIRMVDEGEEIIRRLGIYHVWERLGARHRGTVVGLAAAQTHTMPEASPYHTPRVRATKAALVAVLNDLWDLIEVNQEMSERR